VEYGARLRPSMRERPALAEWFLFGLLIGFAVLVWIR
jgi:hypothetical protein